MSENGAADRPTLLIVDDEPVNVDILREALSAEYRLKVATNGIRALEAMDRTGAPDLVLMDIMMPELDGLAATRRLKADPRFSAVPVVFLTAKSETDDVLAAYDAGGEDYVTKPFKIPELKARIRTHLEIQSGRRLLERKNRDFREMLHILCHDLANPLANVKSVLDMMADDPEGFAAFLPDMQRTVRQGLEIIESVRGMRSLEEKGLDLEPVNLAEAWADAEAMLRHRFVEKGVALRGPGGTVLEVTAHRTSLVTSVISNLLTNALKFTPAGKTVTATAGLSGDGARLSIRDEGIGMPDDILAELFDPLSRITHRDGTDGEPGTGFGMPLVKEFMVAYGGDIDVQTAEGEGTEIILDFRVPGAR